MVDGAVARPYNRRTMRRERVEFRCSHEELCEIEERARHLGLSVSAFLRLIARHGSLGLPVDPGSRSVSRELHASIHPAATEGDP